VKKCLVYVHGKGGSAAEAEHYKPLFHGDDVIGFDYRAQTPWEAKAEFTDYFARLSGKYDSLILAANSIGAFFSLCSLREIKLEKAFLISPIVNMEELISDMMLWAGVSEDRLREEKTIETPFGETLSWEYLQWVRENPVRATAATLVLRGSEDTLQSLETIRAFCDSCGAELTVMEGGEHWFHTDEQMAFLDNWISENRAR